MNIHCHTPPCEVILNSTCVFYEGPNLIWAGINTNDTLQVAIEKLDEMLHYKNDAIITKAAVESVLTGEITSHTHSTDGMVLSQDVANIVKITQAEYDILDPPVSTTLYLIIN